MFDEGDWNIFSAQYLVITKTKAVTIIEHTIQIFLDALSMWQNGTCDV